ncbi:hypothetical protein SCACP_25550 [Sporomusa carbonis]
MAVLRMRSSIDDNPLLRKRDFARGKVSRTRVDFKNIWKHRKSDLLSGAARVTMSDYKGAGIWENEF